MRLVRTKREIMAEIYSKKLELRKLRKQGEEADTKTEVRSISAAMDKVCDAIDELEDELYKLDLLEGSDEDEERANDPGWVPTASTPIPANAVKKGDSAIPSMRGKTLGSFGSVGLSVPESAIALRSNEKMTDRVPMTERKHLDLGKYIRGAVTGNWNGAAEERSAFSTTATGVIIPQILSAQIIDRARELSLFTSANVPVIPMETNNITIARVSSDPVFEFKEELAEASESSFSLDSVELKAKTAYGYCYVSLEAINSAQNLGDIILQVFGQAMANMIDKAFLYGQADGQGGYDSFAPSGIAYDSDINVIQATNYYFSDFINGIGAVKENNGIPTVIAMNAKTETQLALLRDANAADIKEPVQFETMQKIVSNQLSYDESTGSDAIVFDPNAMIIGTQKNIVIRMFEDSDYCIKHGAVGFQVYAMTDCQIVQPKHICLITGYTGMETEQDTP